MNNFNSDALVFFGVAGDLAYKKIFPALQAMIKRGHLNVPVIGVARAESVQITMAENFGIQGRGAFYDQTGAIRDVVQNHLFQVLTNLTMEPPVRTDSESIRDEKVKVLRAIRPLEQRNLVRGQFRGYRSENGVASNSQVETFVALQLEIDSWRWRGVPFYIRAGKSLPVTCTEVLVQLRQPPTMY
jgi:glucose-6-phosphate 1-dehydrogenase